METNAAPERQNTNGWRLVPGDDSGSQRDSSSGGPPDLTKLLEDFASYLVGLHKSERTVEEYVADVRRWALWWRRNPVEFTSKDWDAWTNSLACTHISGKSIRRYHAGVRRFFKYLRRVNLCSHDPGADSEPIKVSKKVPELLSKEEVEAILQHSKSARARTMMELMYSCGLRNSEVRHLLLENVGSDYIRIVGKGDKERLIPLMPRTREALEQWIRLRSENESTYLFPSLDGKPVRMGNLSRDLKRAVRGAGISRRIHPHTFRHSIATYLLNAGMDIKFIKEFLGHDSIATTELYARLAKDALKERLGSFHPRT